MRFGLQSTENGHAGAASKAAEGPRYPDLASDATCADDSGTTHTGSPLSFSQERLWFVEQMEVDPAVYLITNSFRLRGPLDVPALERSLREIVRRHAVLRSSFPVQNGAPVQVTGDWRFFCLERDNVTERCRSDREAFLTGYVSRIIGQGIDIINGPVFRSVLARLGENDYCLVLVWHHIVFDGTSVGIFLSELKSIYAAVLDGQASPLPDPVAQYSDLAAEQRHAALSGRFDNQLNYWRDALGNRNSFELPSDYARPAVRTVRGQVVSETIEEDLLEGIRRLGGRARATLFMTLLAAFKIVLSRQANLSDVLIGSPVTGRTNVRAEELIGCFLNTIVLRADLSENSTFTEFLGQLRGVALDGFSNQDIPFEMVLDELRPERDSSRTPIFQVFFNMLYGSDAAFELPGLTIDPITTPVGRAKFDLTLYVMATDRRVRLNAAYNEDVFSRARITALLAQYTNLLREIVENPERKIGEYSMLPEGLKPGLPDPTDPLSGAWRGSVPELVAERASEDSQKIAVRGGDTATSYGMLNERAGYLARLLIERGVGKGDVVAIYAYRSPALVPALLGIMRAGAAFLVLDPAYPAARLLGYVDVARPSAVVKLEPAGEIPDELAFRFETLAAGPPIELSTEGDVLYGPPPDADSGVLPDVHVDAEDRAYISFTSGSTGIPKGIVGRHGPLTHFQAFMQDRFGLTRTDRVSMLSGLSHDPLHRDILCTLVRGATVCVPEPEWISSDRLATWLEEEEVTVLHLTPAMAKLLTADPTERTLPDVRIVFMLGDELTQTTIRDLVRLCPNASIINLYGTTETQRAVGYYAAWPTASSTREGERKLAARVPLGTGIEDVQLLVLNRAGHLAGPFEIGEIHIRSPHLAEGYLNDSEQTSARFLVNPFTEEATDRLYRTGDLGYSDDAGSVYFYGREDGQITIRGFRIETAEVVAALRGHPLVRDAVVRAADDTNSQKQLVAYVAVDDAADVSLASVRIFLRDRLPHYMIPTAVVPLPAIPLTPNGKIAYRDLPPPDHMRHVAEDTFVAPETELERQLAGIFEETLQTSPVGVLDNFFDLGGHSLLAVDLLSRVNASMGFAPSLATFFQRPTVRDLAEGANGAATTSRSRHLVPLQPTGSGPPLYCVHNLGSSTLHYAAFARHFAGNRPVYGVQGAGLDGERIDFSSVEAMAEAYVAEIAAFQPEGSIYLLGFCFGSRIVLEIARQFKARGRNVAFVGLVDGRSPIVPKLRRPTRERISSHLDALRRDGFGHLLKAVKYLVSMRLRRVRTRVNQRLAELAVRMNIRLPKLLLFDYVMRTNFEIMKKYRIRRHEGDLTVFRSTSWSVYPEDLGWGPYCSGHVSCHTIEGPHGLWKEPHTKDLFEAVRDSLPVAIAPVESESI